MKRLACLALISSMLMILFAPMVSAQPSGPRIDRLRYQVILNPSFDWYPPDEMLRGRVDVSTQMTEFSDLVDLDEAGFTITYSQGFHICFFGFNIRPLSIQQERRPELTFWPLADVNFRHALAHSLDREGIFAGDLIRTPWNSPVPPTLGGWYNPAIPQHPFNLGDPFASTEYDPETGENDDTCSILRYGGYSFVDADYSGDVTFEDYWRCPNNDPLPEMEILFPSGNNDMQKHVLTLKWIGTGLKSIGLYGTDVNDWSGLTLRGELGFESGYEFWTYISRVYNADFDAFIVNFKLNRFPDYLYDWFHSSQDSWYYPGRFNAFGTNDPTLDGLLETLKFSLDHAAKLCACHDIQTWLASPDNPQAFPIIPYYWMTYYDTFNPDLRGIVPSPGFGAGDGGCVALREPDGPNPSLWTYLDIHWEPGTERIDEVTGDTLIIWTLSDFPERFNPLYAGSTSAWEILDRVFDPLIMMNPYTHEDLPWLAEDWDIEKWATEAEVDELLEGVPEGEVVPGPPIIDSHWHEAWPLWSRNWDLTSWGDADSSRTLTVGDHVDFEHDPNIYLITDVAWDINVENKSDTYNEMGLHSLDGLFDLTSPVGTQWHELWPDYSSVWTAVAWEDRDGSGALSRLDQIQLDDETWCQVDSVSITLELDREPDGIPERYVEFVGTGMKVKFWLRDDVFWQDGNQYTAEDAVLNWLFLRDNQIPRYTSMWEHLVDASTVGPDFEPHFKVVAYLSVTGQFLLYDLASTGAILPPQIWLDWYGAPLDEILNRDLSLEPGWNGVTPTNLFGTGPFVFEFFDPSGDPPIGDLTANDNYFRTSASIQDQKVEMFYRCGDVNRDGLVWADDRGHMGLLFGMMKDIDPEYDENVDVNKDGIIDMGDIAVANYFFGTRREHP